MRVVVVEMMEGEMKMRVEVSLETMRMVGWWKLQWSVWELLSVSLVRQPFWMIGGRFFLLSRQRRFLFFLILLLGSFSLLVISFIHPTMISR
jgi:hypothetical protein